jgi:hypothetical protein
MPSANLKLNPRQYEGSYINDVKVLGGEGVKEFVTTVIRNQ